MRSLKDYLNNTQQYEGILDPDQNQVIDRMTDDAIRRCIREYCTWGRQEHQYSVLWPAADVDLKITKIDKDKQGWYIETSSVYAIFLIYNEKKAKSFYEYCLSKGQKIDEQKGFLIEDIGIYFRWRKHSGCLRVSHAPNFKSTQGLPDELNELDIWDSCKNSKGLDVCTKINTIVLDNIGDIKISGNGCKNAIIHPHSPCGNITAPDGVKIHRPGGYTEYDDLINKLIH